MAKRSTIGDTSPERVVILFLAIVVISLLFEKLTHYLDHALKGKMRRGLRHAVHYIEEELLALGLISLFLIVSEEYLLKICVHDDEDSSEEEITVVHDEERRKLLESDEEASTCPEGKEPYWSAQTIHQTHILIFLVAVVHVLYATVSILICLWRMKRWKVYEDQPDHALKSLGNTKLIYGRNRFEYWFWSFWAQFSPSMDKSLYLSMRCLFIERMEFPHDFDFLGFVVNTLVSEFAMVVHADWIMWGVVAIWICIPEFLLITTALSVFIVLVAGTKLELVGVKLTQMAYLSYGDRTNADIKEIRAPTSIIRMSVRTVADKLSQWSTKTDGDDSVPKPSASSFVTPGIRGDAVLEDMARRVHSCQSGRMQSMDLGDDEIDSNSFNIRAVTAPSQRHEVTFIDVPEKKQRSPKKPQLHFGCFKKHHFAGSAFSTKYSLPDSAKLFWFQKPQLILSALRFVYFETAMAIATVLFDFWQKSDFIIDKIRGFHSEYIPISILITFGVLCLLHTSFLMLPTYALTMVAGSHCPETVIKIAKKMNIEADKIMRIESLHGENLGSEEIVAKEHKKRGKHEKHPSFFRPEGPEKTISSLVDAMYKGKLQRYADQGESSPKSIGNNESSSTASIEERSDDFPELSKKSTASDSSCMTSSSNKEIEGILALFGSFENFLESLKFAQVAVLQMTPNARFSFDCLAGSFHGRDRTMYDTAAINLTFDLMTATLGQEQNLDLS